MVVKCFAVIFAFPCSIILLTNSAVSLRVLGTLNGVAVSISAVGRAVGPALGGAAFTWGLERGYVITPWWLLGSIAALGAIPIWYLEEMEGFNKTASDSDSESSESDDEEQEALLNTIEEESRGGILNGDEMLQGEEALEFIDENSMSRTQSRRSQDGPGRHGEGSRHGHDHRSSGEGPSSSFKKGSGFERRLSSPIGLREPVGPGGRRLSNGLAGSGSGYGTGGTSFA